MESKHILDISEEIRKIDPDDMYHRIVHMPEQAFMAYNETEPILPDDFSDINVELINKVVICGMGGSAISGDIAEAVFGKYLPIKVVKNYHIPILDEKTLVVIMSYSGNTEETVSCLQQAVNSTKFIAAVTSGGKVKDIVNGSYPWMQLPAGNPPRSAIAWLFISLVKLLEIYRIIPSQKIVVKKVIANLIKKAGAICMDSPLEGNIAKSSALKIDNKIPLIYTSDPSFSPLSYRWKCQFNENSKHPAFSNTFPEMNHNEIVGWEDKTLNDKFLPIFLKRIIDKPEYEKRIKVVKELLAKNNVDYLEFYVEGDNLMEEIFSLIYLGDMISYYLAIIKNVDPTEIDNINFLKKNI